MRRLMDQVVSRSPHFFSSTAITMPATMIATPMKITAPEIRSKGPLAELVKELLMPMESSTLSAKGGAEVTLPNSSYQVTLLMALELANPPNPKSPKESLTVLKKLRKQGISTPALFLTARTEVYQKVEGLDAGADDYLPKPFDTAELLARVRAMLRRKDRFTPDVLSFAGMTLNCSTYEICWGDRTQALRGKEYQVLEMLMQRPGMVVSTEQFITHIWGWETSVDTCVVWVHVSNIRKKLEQIGAPVGIRFLRNAGYVLEELK